VPFEHRDRRLGGLEDAVEDARGADRDLVGRAVADEVAHQLVEVEPGAEGSVAAAENHHPDVVVLLGPDPRLVELLEELLAHGVELVRTIEPDSGDVPVDLVLNGLGFHCTRHWRHLSRIS